MSVFAESLMAFARILACDGDRRWIGMGEVEDKTGKMQIFALSFVKSVSGSSRKQGHEFKANKDGAKKHTISWCEDELG